MRKEILDLYLFVFGLKKSIRNLRKYPKYGDLWYKGYIIECGAIIKFLDKVDEDYNKYIQNRISNKSIGDSSDKL